MSVGNAYESACWIISKVLGEAVSDYDVHQAIIKEFDVEIEGNDDA